MQLRIRTFEDHRKRQFEVVEHRSSGILILKEDDGTLWSFDAPLSVVPLLAEAIAERKLSNAVSLKISGYMSGKTATMCWKVQ